MEILQTIKKGSAKIQFATIEGLKFRIRYEQNYACTHPYDRARFHTAVLTSENGWVVIADEEDIMFERALFQDSQNHEENATEFFTAMRCHLKMLYR